MNSSGTGGEGRMAVLVDCDNTTPEILEFARRILGQFGRMVLRRGDGKHTTMAKQMTGSLGTLGHYPLAFSTNMRRQKHRRHRAGACHHGVTFDERSPSPDLWSAASF